MPEYLHKCHSCGHEWEETYSIKADPPKICPECKAESVQRLINGYGGGRMELTGDELKANLKQDVAKLKKEIYSKEKNYSNFIGEDRYQNIQSNLDKRRR